MGKNMEIGGSRLQNNHSWEWEEAEDPSRVSRSQGHREGQGTRGQCFRLLGGHAPTLRVQQGKTRGEESWAVCCL